MKAIRGNALFLILIAVALFAALSYVVTTSGRGGGTVDKEQDLIRASQVTQYAASVRTATTRLILTGTDVASLDFASNATGGDAVFATDGGGVIYDVLPGGIMSTGTDTAWVYHPDLGIAGVGTTNNDVVGMAITLKQGICEQINKGLVSSSTIGCANVSGVPEFTNIIGGTGTYDIDATECPACDGEPFLCTDLSAGGCTGVVYTYYHVLVEQ